MSPSLIRGKTYKFKPDNASLYFIVTPGPGTYVLPSDFGYLENPNRSPRGGTAGTMTRPRLNFKSQLSTLTGQPELKTRMSDFNTDRNNLASLTMTEKKNRSVMQDMKGNHLESL